MAEFQIISEKNKPKFVVLPFGDEEAVQDYMDELWAEKAVMEFNKSKPKKLYSLDEVKRQLEKDNHRNIAPRIERKKEKVK